MEVCQAAVFEKKKEGEGDVSVDLGIELGISGGGMVRRAETEIYLRVLFHFW